MIQTSSALMQNFESVRTSILENFISFACLNVE
jgi:hypothetical protein